MEKLLCRLWFGEACGDMLKTSICELDEGWLVVLVTKSLANDCWTTGLGLFTGAKDEGNAWEKSANPDGFPEDEPDDGANESSKPKLDVDTEAG